MELFNRVELKIVLCVFITFITSFVNAQQISLELNGGMSGVKYNIEKGNGTLGIGGGVGLNYTLRMNNSFGILAGVHVGLNNSEVLLDDGSYTSNEVDNTNTAFQLKVNTSKYKEEQKLYALSIPVLLQYSSDVTVNSKFYLLGGAKFIFPINQETNSQANSLQIHGYYPNAKLNVTDLPQHGFGSLSNWKDEQTQSKLSTIIALSVQSGMGFYVGRRLFYIGAYFDYGINDASASSKEDSFIVYSVKDIKETKSRGVSNFILTKEAKFMAVGLSLKFFLTDFRGPRY